MLTLLSDLLRITLDSRDQVVSLREELAFLDRYLEIERIRFEDRLTLERDIDPDALTAEVPSLLLQPLVENAIGHGISRRAGPGTVRIEAAIRDGEVLELRCWTPGPGIAPGRLPGGGGRPTARWRPARAGPVSASRTRGRASEQLYGDRHELASRIARRAARASPSACRSASSAVSPSAARSARGTRGRSQTRMTDRIRVLIVDDEPLAREGVRLHLASAPDMQVVGEAGSGDEAVVLIEELKPDLLFLDVRMPGPGRLRRARGPRAGQMPLTIFTTAYDQFALRAFDAHAIDYILKPYDAERFGQALDRARMSASPPGAGAAIDERLNSLLEELRARSQYAEAARRAGRRPHRDPARGGDRLDRGGVELRAAPRRRRGVPAARDDDGARGEARSRAVRPDPPLHHRAGRPHPRAGAAVPGRLRGDPAGRHASHVEPRLPRPAECAASGIAWSRIAHTHYDTAFGGVDWPGVRHELRPRAAAASSLSQLRAVLQEMLDRLGESHYGLLPQEATDALALAPDGAASLSGEAGLSVRLVDTELLVARVDDDGAGAAAGVRTGWTLLDIEGRPLAPRIERVRQLPAAERRTARTRLLYQVHAELAGEVGQPLQLRLRNAAGDVVERRLVLHQSRGELVQYGNLPPALARLEHELLPIDGGCVGVIRMSIWLGPLAAPFDRAVDAMRHCDGVIVDLRGNPGGVAGLVIGTAGHFVPDTVTLGIMRMRGTELRFRANPRRARADGTRVEPFAGPLAVLTDEMTASTSEFFAAGLQTIGRARVFGSPSAGQALPASLIRLPTGDVMMHVIADFTGPGDVRIEGRGVIPDEHVPLLRQDLLAERDAPLMAALAWITGATSAGQLHNGGR
jgi:carboxyl-terminal processing protease